VSSGELACNLLDKVFDWVIGKVACMGDQTRFMITAQRGSLVLKTSPSQNDRFAGWYV
jgi:hypothetical protein